MFSSQREVGNYLNGHPVHVSNTPLVCATKTVSAHSSLSLSISLPVFALLSCYSRNAVVLAALPERHVEGVEVQVA